MNRRNFLKHFSLATSGLVAAPLFAHAATTDAHESFSLNLITADAEAALPALEALLQAARPASKHVRYAEYPLAGSHLGDLVLIKGNRLVDYRNSTEAFAAQARALAKSLGLPRRIENPVLLKFYSQAQNAKPESANVFVNNVLVQRLALDEQPRAHEIEGLKGCMALAVRNGSVKVAGASCQHQTCVKLGAINQAGQHLICIPNAVRITIEGRNESGVDGVTF